MEGMFGGMGSHVLERTEREPGSGEQHEISKVSPQFEPEQDMRRVEEEEARAKKEEEGTEEGEEEGVETVIEKKEEEEEEVDEEGAEVLDFHEIDNTYDYAQHMITNCVSVENQAALERLYEQMVKEAEVRRREIRKKEFGEGSRYIPRKVPLDDEQNFAERKQNVLSRVPLIGSILSRRAREQEEKAKNSIIMDTVLPPKSAEHREVSELFHQMDDGQLQILSIEKVTNDGLEDKFEERKRAYSEMYGDVDVHNLWHGNKLDNIPTILENNIEVARFSLSGMYGTGVRFSSSPQLASMHCDRGETGSMLLCKVLISTMMEVGGADWIESNEPPVIAGREPLRYDTTTNSKEGMHAIVKFEDHSFLPTHVVHFRRCVLEEKEDEIDYTFYNYAQDLSADCELVDNQAELDKLYEQMLMEAEVRRQELRKEELEVLQAQHDLWGEDLRLAEVRTTRQFSLRAYQKRMEELEMLEILTHQHTLWQEDLEEQWPEKNDKYGELWLDEQTPVAQPNLESREGAQNQVLKDEQHLAAEQNQALEDEQPEQNKVTKFLFECKKEDVNSLWGYH
ncbi:uncharacterized protein LOC113216720 isoform X2 [Frankliniella occidentalis]|nr:uncharacterized protein LOC113216720 isoform X2 [Frankliniella occidentalis]